MRADGSPRIRLSSIGMGPAVGRAQPTHGPLRLGFQSRASPWWGSEMLLWFEMAVFSCLNICVYLSFTAHQVGCRASGFLLAYHRYSIPCCYASAVWPRCIASSLFCFVLFFSFVGLSEWTTLYPFTCHLKTRPSRYYGRDNPHAELGRSQLLFFFLVVLKELCLMH